MRRIVLNVSIYYDIYIYIFYISFFFPFSPVPVHRDQVPLSTVPPFPNSPTPILVQIMPCSLWMMSSSMVRHRHQPVGFLNFKCFPFILIQVSSDIINPPTITIMHGCELSKRYI